MCNRDQGRKKAILPWFCRTKLENRSVLRLRYSSTPRSKRLFLNKIEEKRKSDAFKGIFHVVSNCISYSSSWKNAKMHEKSTAEVLYSDSYHVKDVIRRSQKRLDGMPYENAAKTKVFWPIMAVPHTNPSPDLRRLTFPSEPRVSRFGTTRGLTNFRVKSWAGLCAKTKTSS